jgi:hypothetical protein
MFGGKEVNSERVSKYITPGVHEVTIARIEGVKSQNGNPMLNISLHLKDGDSENANIFRVVMQKTDGTDNEMSLKKIQHLATKIVTKDQYLAATGDTIEEYGENLSNLLSGNSVRMKFVAEEYVKQDGNTGVRANIGLPEFAEAIQEGSEYSVVEVTKLVYDPSNQYDYKKLPAKPDVAVPSFGGESMPGF